MIKTPVPEVAERIMSKLIEYAGDLLPRATTNTPMPPASRGDIYVDDTEVDITEEELIDLLIPFIRIGRGSGKITLTSSFDQLDSKQKVLVILFAEKLRSQYMDNSYTDDEFLSPNQISELSETKINEIYPAIRTLEQEGILTYESKRGRYCISTNPNKFSLAKNKVSEAGAD